MEMTPATPSAGSAPKREDEPRRARGTSPHQGQQRGAGGGVHAPVGARRRVQVGAPQAARVG